LLFGCSGPVKDENKNNTSANSVSPGQKYIIDTKESVLTWKGSMLLASEEEHIGYVYISKKSQATSPLKVLHTLLLFQPKWK
jgi:hypothetical protein